AVTPLWPAYLQVLVAAALINILALAAPLFIMNVYDRVLPNKAIPTLWVLAIGVILAILFDFILKMLRNGLIGNAGRRADVLLASRLFSHVLNLDLSKRPMKTGEFANQLRDFEIVREFFTSNTVVNLTDFIFIWLFIFIIFQIAGILALAPAVAVIAVLLVGLLLQFPLRRIVGQAQSEATHRHSLLIEALTGLETIKTSRAESQFQDQWEQFVGRNARTAEKLRSISAFGTNFTALAQQLVTVGVVIIGVYMFDQGEVSPGAIIASVILAGRAVAPLGQIAATIGRSQQAIFSLRTLNQVMSVPGEDAGQERHLNRKMAAGSVVFDKVSFTYPGAECPAVNEFSVKIRPGERVGIIGRIGSGKTTLGRLIARLYQPTEGSLLLDDVEIRQYHSNEVRRRVAFVSQDSSLFHGTVRDNIVLGTPNISDDLVLRAADLAGVSEFVKLHPQGFNMPVGETGRFLSSGQRQTIALARAFLSDPLIVFLDEPSGSMDPASEQALLERLRTAFRPDQTLIVTTHRMAILALVSRLIVIENGRVVADGPRDIVLEALRTKADKQASDNTGSRQRAGKERSVRQRKKSAIKSSASDNDQKKGEIEK
ncbi:MAG: type I secretion system permease/ATPase, partial [Methyloligellaceae bacterium]